MNDLASLERRLKALEQVIQCSGANVTIRSGGALVIQAGSHAQISAGSGLTLSSASALNIEAGSALSMKARANATLEFTAGVQVTAGGQLAMQAGGAALIRSGSSAKLQCATSLQVEAPVIELGKTAKLEADDQLGLECGPAKLVLRKDGSVNIDSKDFTARASGKADIRSSGEMTLKGSKITQN